MFGLSIEERAARKGQYWRVIHETTDEVIEGKKLLELAMRYAANDFMVAPFNYTYHNPRYMAHFILAYTHSHVVSDILPKEAVVGWVEQVRNLG